MEKEVGALLELDCFYKDLDDTWQRTTLHMVFDVKQSVDRKAWLVAAGGGHLVDILDIQVYLSTVKSISVQVLHVISPHKAGLEQLVVCGDIGIAFQMRIWMRKYTTLGRPGLNLGNTKGGAVLSFKKGSTVYVPAVKGSMPISQIIYKLLVSCRLVSIMTFG